MSKPIIFTPILSGIERRLHDAAYGEARRVVGKLKEATYQRSAGHWDGERNADITRNDFWLQAEKAHMNGLLHAVKRDIEEYAIKRIKETAQQWENDAKGAC